MYKTSFRFPVGLQVYHNLNNLWCKARSSCAITHTSPTSLLSDFLMRKNSIWLCVCLILTWLTLLSLQRTCYTLPCSPQRQTPQFIHSLNSSSQHLSHHVLYTPAVHFLFPSMACTIVIHMTSCLSSRRTSPWRSTLLHQGSKACTQQNI